MALEAGTYISDLVVTNPTGTDNRREGDDHLRLLKSTLKNTFPNVTGPVTVTQAELNHLAGVTSAVQTQLNAKEPTISSTNRVPAAYVGTGVVSDTEFNYLNGVTSAVQTQLNSKASLNVSTGEVGSYAFMMLYTLSASITPGQTASGSSLKYTGVAMSGSNGGEVLAVSYAPSPGGSWRAMGYCTAVASKFPATLWQRYA